MYAMSIDIFAQIWYYYIRKREEQSKPSETTRDKSGNG